jgi:hypothetical protein
MQGAAPDLGEIWMASLEMLMHNKSLQQTPEVQIETESAGGNSAAVALMRRGC